MAPDTEVYREPLRRKGPVALLMVFQRIQGRGLRRLGWGVADQGMSSLTNFLVTVTLAHTLGAEQFGAFSLAYVTYAFALTASRAVATDPLMVRFSGADTETWKRAVAKSSATAATVGTVIGVCLIAVLPLIGDTARGAFLALALTLPGLLLQDSWRFAFFALGRGGHAFLNDFAWAIALLPVLLFLGLTGQASAFLCVLAWGAAASVAAILGLVQTGIVPQLGQVKEWLSLHRDLGPRYLAEGTTSSVTNQLRTYGTGLILGLAAVGYLQAANTLMGPFMIVFFGVGSVIVPEVSRVLRTSPRRLPLACLAFGGGLAVLGFAWGTVLLAVLPHGLGQLMLGQIWVPTYPLVSLVTLAVMGGGIQSGAGAGLRALGAARLSLRAMLVSSAIYLVCTLVGAFVGGIVGSAAGAAVAAWLGAAVWWAYLYIASRDADVPWRAPRWWHRSVPPLENDESWRETLAGASAPYHTGQSNVHVDMRHDCDESRLGYVDTDAGPASPPLIVATILRDEGVTGVHTHFQQLRRYLDGCGTSSDLVTPFSWGRALVGPAFGPRLVLQRISGSANVAWYRYWHEVFLRNALRRRLAAVDDCVIYAQCPLAARAALRARRGPHQRVVMAVHFSISQADEWVHKKQISPEGRVFRGIRDLERDVIPRLDGLVYVSEWTRQALGSWFPAARDVPSAVIPNFVAQMRTTVREEPVAELVTVGGLEISKNHRYMLQVLAEANRAGRPITLDVFGEGPQRGDIIKQVDSLGLHGQVQLRGFRRDVRELLPGYKAYVHASYSESSSLAIIEAMAAGLPIVAGNIGPLGELFDDGVEGRVWPLDDPARAASILIELLDNEWELSRAAGAARARFSRDFEAEVVGPRLLSFLMHTRAG